jgi:hypothetical protein
MFHVKRGGAGQPLALLGCRLPAPSRGGHAVGVLGLNAKRPRGGWPAGAEIHDLLLRMPDLRFVVKP